MSPGKQKQQEIFMHHVLVSIAKGPVVLSKRRKKPVCLCCLFGSQNSFCHKKKKEYGNCK